MIKIVAAIFANMTHALLNNFLCLDLEALAIGGMNDLHITITLCFQLER